MDVPNRNAGKQDPRSTFVSVATGLKHNSKDKDNGHEVVKRGNRLPAKRQDDVLLL